jgi:hypothetical protein
MTTTTKAEECALDIIDLISPRLKEGLAWIGGDEAHRIGAKYGIAHQSMKSVYPFVRKAISPDELEIFKEAHGGERMAFIMNTIKANRAITDDVLAVKLKERFPDTVVIGNTLNFAKKRLGLIQGSSAAPSGPTSEVAIYVTQYHKLIERLHGLEIEITEVEAEIEKYRPIVKAMEMMRDGIRYIKENAK